MFYSQFILAKKGPLGTIWIAAHLERKLRKNQVAETNIGVSVDSILFPDVPIALRLSGHLLLGVVRIYSKKVNYLFNDCSEALLKIKQAFQSTVVDLPPEAATAPFHSITLPETFDFDELELLQDSENTFFQSNGNYVDHHISTREQITLQDPAENTLYLGSSQIGLDERFGDGDCSQMGLDFDEDFLDEKPRSPPPSTPLPMLQEEMTAPMIAYGGDEAIKMDIDVYDQPSTSSFLSERIIVDERMDIDAHHHSSTLSGGPHMVIVNEPGTIDVHHQPKASIIGSQRMDGDQQVMEPGAIDAHCQPTALVIGSQRINGDQQVNEVGTVNAQHQRTASSIGSQRIQVVTNALAPDDHIQVDGHHQDLHAHYDSSIPRANTDEQGSTNDLGIDRLQVDGHRSVPSLDSLLGSLDQVTDAKIPSKAREFHLHKNDEPVVAKPPLIFEARTPDLNQEFCPPDEPSTPALPEEASLILHKESVLSPDKEKCLPLPLSPERYKASDSLQDFLQTNQFSVPSPLVPTETTFLSIQPQSPLFSCKDQQLDAEACYQQPGLQTQAPHVANFPSFLSQGNASASTSSSLAQGSPMHTSSEAIKGSTIHHDSPIETALTAVDATEHAGFTPFQGFPSCSGPMASNNPPSLGQIQKQPSINFPALDSTNHQPAGEVPPVEVLRPISSPSPSSQNAVSNTVHPVQQGSIAAATQASAPPFQGFLQSGQEFTGVSYSSSGSISDSLTSQNVLFNTSSATSSHQWPIPPRSNQESSLLFQQPAFTSNQKSSQNIISADRLGGMNHVQPLGTMTTSSLPEQSAIQQGQSQSILSSSALLQESAAMQGLAQSSSFEPMNPPSKLQQSSVVQQPSSTINSFVSSEVQGQAQPSASASSMGQQSATVQGQAQPSVSSSSMFQQSAKVQGQAQPSASSSSMFHQSAMVQGQAQPSVSSLSMFHQSAMVQGQAQPSVSSPSMFQQSATVQGQAQPSVSSPSMFQQSAMVQGQAQPSVSSPSMFQQSAMVRGQAQPSVSSSSMFQQSAMVQGHTESSSVGTTVKSPPLFQQPGLQGHLQSPSLGAMNSSSLFQQPAPIGAVNPSSFFQQPAATQGHAHSSSLGTMSSSFLYQQPGAVQGQQFTINEATPKAPSSFLPPNLMSSQPFSPLSKELAQTERMATHSELAHPYSIPQPSSGNGKNQRKAMTHAYEHETLRSYADAQRAERDYLYLRKGTSFETIPHLEMNGRNVHIARTNERLEEMMRPKLDVTPTLREETPFTATKSSPFSNGSFGPIPADDDVLASILGRRGSSFQVIPTPSAKEQPVQKRQRVAPKSIPRKRKFDFDTLTVLHGDVIRQQLANTDDIRRERKKAPCTRREIWRFNKEVQGQQNFGEPSLPELSTNLHDLYHEVLGVDGFKFPSLDVVSESKDTPVVVELETGRPDVENKGNNSVFDNKGRDPMVENKGNDAVVEKKEHNSVVPSFEELPKDDVAVAPLENSCMLANHASKGAADQLETSSAVCETSLAVCLPDASSSRGLLPHPHVAGEAALPVVYKAEEFLVSTMECKDAAIEISKSLSCTEREDITPSIANFPNVIIQAGDNLCTTDVQGLESTNAHSSVPREREAIRQVPEQAIEQVPEQAIEQVPEQAIEQVPEQAIEQVQVPEQAIEQVPDQAIEQVHEQVRNHAIEQVHDQVSNQAIGQLHEQVSKQLPQQAIKHVHEQAYEQVPDQVSKQGPEQAFEESPNQACKVGLEQASKQGPEQAVEELPEQASEKGLEQASKKGLVQAPEQVSMQALGQVLEQAAELVPEQVISEPTSIHPVVRDGHETSKTTNADVRVGEEMATLVVQVDSREAGIQVEDPLGADSKIDTDLSCLPFCVSDSVSIPEMPASAADLNNESMLIEERQTSDKLDKEKDVKENEVAEQDPGVPEDQKDTEAMDAEDDMTYEGFEDSASDDEYTIQDDSGWSTRTRNVGRYLKTVFEGMGSNAKRLEGDGQPRLGLERLLQRKTKKEAARMFFETLVLKTKDYVHVEQQGAYGDVHLYPSSKLMKTIF